MQIVGGISLQDLSRLLGGAAATFGRIRGVENDDGDPDYVDEEEEDAGSYYGQYQRTAHQWFPAVTDPQEAGLHLLMSGEFGRVGQKLGQRHNNMDVARLLRDRGTKARSFNYREDIISVSWSTSCCIFTIYSSQNLVPNTNGTAVASSPANIYSGQFSKGLVSFS